MSRKLMMMGAALAVVLGLVGTVGSGVAAAHGKTDTGGGSTPHGRNSTSFAGTTTCSVHGKLTFTPPMVSGGTATSTVTVTGLLRGCTSTNQGKVKFNNGHLSALVGTLGQNDCSSLASVLAPSLSGGSIMWTPPSKVARSKSVSMPAGTASEVASGGNSVMQISYLGGSVGSGSFANTAGSSLTLASTQDTLQLSERCVNGLANLAFSGKATL